MAVDLIFDRNNEYFLAIGKQELHSFLMLGVMHDNCPKLLARVGKINDIDPDIDSHCKLVIKNLSVGSLARLADEGIARRSSQQVSIAYQAYSINYEQMKEFLALITYIEEKQLAKEKVKTAISRTYKTEVRLDRQLIHAYVPIEEVPNTNQVLFRYRKLSECSTLTNEYLKNLEHPHTIAKEVNKIKISNTCRHSALKMIETILHYKIGASKQFFIPLHYQTNLKGGLPDKHSFYILPPPPICYKNLTKPQSQTLNQLHQRLKQIPKLHGNDPKTRMKFNELKDLYKMIADPTKLSAADLLLEIILFENRKKEILFKQRSNHFINFFTPQSATEKTFQKIKVNLVNATFKDSSESSLQP